MSGSTFASKDAVDPIIHKEYLYELVDAYLPAGVDRKDPRVSPLYADLTGFPPLLIQVGSAETLLDDATRLANVAGAADAAVTLEIWPQMIHALPLWNARVEACRLALAIVVHLDRFCGIENHNEVPRYSGRARAVVRCTAPLFLRNPRVTAGNNARA